MKKLLPILFISLFSAFAAQAQPGDEEQPGGQKGEIIRKLLIYQMTKKLDLSEAEAQKFWPVFNNYEKEWRTAIKNNKDDVIKRNEAILSAQKKYKPDFQRVLNSEDRANRVFKEHDNIIEQLKKQAERMKERRENNPRMQRRGGMLKGNI